jgi:hypothetical protein
MDNLNEAERIADGDGAQLYAITLVLIDAARSLRTIAQWCDEHMYSKLS